MLVHSLILLSFSVMVLLVFYHLPDRYKLIAKRGSRMKKINTNSITGTMVETEERQSEDVDEGGGSGLARKNSKLPYNNVEKLLSLHMMNQPPEEMVPSSPRFE